MLMSRGRASDNVISILISRVVERVGHVTQERLTIAQLEAGIQATYRRREALRTAYQRAVAAVLEDGHTREALTYRDAAELLFNAAVEDLERLKGQLRRTCP